MLRKKARKGRKHDGRTRRHQDDLERMWKAAENDRGRGRGSLRMSVISSAKEANAGGVDPIEVTSSMQSCEMCRFALLRLRSAALARLHLRSRRGDLQRLPRQSVHRSTPIDPLHPKYRHTILRPRLGPSSLSSPSSHPDYFPSHTYPPSTPSWPSPRLLQSAFSHWHPLLDRSQHILCGTAGSAGPCNAGSRSGPS
jgi:hypothetical protein